MIDTTFGQDGVTYVSPTAINQTHVIAAAGAPGDRTVVLEQGGTIARLNADGSVDASFGRFGFVKDPLSSSTAVAVDVDGRIYLGSDGFVERLLPDGSRDATFGVGGAAQTTPQTSRFYFRISAVRSLVIDSRGDVYVGGSARRDAYSGVGRFAVAKLDASGQLDATFGEGGVATAVFTRHGHEQSAGVGAIALDARGDVVAAGGGERWLEVVRFMPSGRADPSFGSGGTVRLNNDGSESLFGAVAIGEDGAVYAAGGSSSLGPTGTGAAPLVVARLTDGGQLDAGFGAGGIVSVPIGVPANFFYQTQAVGLLPMPAGRVLVAAGVSSAAPSSYFIGTKPYEDDSGVLLAQLDDRGVADASFAPSLSADVPGGEGPAGWRFLAANESASAFVPGTGGRFRLAIGGGPRKSTGDRSTVFGFTADGVLDRAFGRRGVASADRSVAAAVGHVSPLTGSGPTDPISVGFTVAGAATSQRLNADGTALGVSGLGPVAFQADGKYFATFFKPGRYVELIRYKADGSADTTFGRNGAVRFDLQENFNAVEVGQVLPRADGSVVFSVLNESRGLENRHNVETLYACDATGRVTASIDSPETGVFNGFYDLTPAYARLALTQQGDVLVLNEDRTSQSDTFSLLKLNGADLLPDFGFGQEAVPAALRASDVIVLPDESIRVTGTDGTTKTFASAAFSAAGVLDPAFGAGGVSTTPASDFGTAIVEPDGKQLVALTERRGVIFVSRYDDDGSLDATFGSGGTAVVYFGRSDAIADVGLAIEGTAQGPALVVAGGVERAVGGGHRPSSDNVVFVTRLGL